MFCSGVEENSLIDDNSQNVSVKLYEYVLFVKILVIIDIISFENYLEPSGNIYSILPTLMNYETLLSKPNWGHLGLEVFVGVFYWKYCHQIHLNGWWLLKNIGHCMKQLNRHITMIHIPRILDRTTHCHKTKMFVSFPIYFMQNSIEK